MHETVFNDSPAGIAVNGSVRKGIIYRQPLNVPLGLTGELGVPYTRNRQQRG